MSTGKGTDKSSETSTEGSNTSKSACPSAAVVSSALFCEAGKLSSETEGCSASVELLSETGIDWAETSKEKK